MNKMRRLLLAAEVFQHLTTECTMALVGRLVPIIVLPREYVLLQVKLCSGEVYESSAADRADVSDRAQE